MKQKHNGSQENATQTMQQAQQEACAHFPQSMPVFRQWLQQDMEHNAFREWIHYFDDNITESAGESVENTLLPSRWAFPRLDLKLLDQAFGNKTVAFIGDSTSHNILKTLYWMMVLAEQEGEDVDAILSNSSFSLTSAFQLLEGISRSFVNEDFVVQRNGGHLFWKGMRGKQFDHCETDTVLRWNWIKDQKPHVIVAHFGAHLLHAGIDNLYKSNLCQANSFIHHEGMFLEKVIQVAKEAGTKLLLFKTNNFFCFDKWLYKKDVPPLASPERIAFETKCIETLTEKIKSPKDNPHGLNLTVGDLESYCKHAVWSDNAMELQNQRMRDFLLKKSPPGMTIGVYNDRDNIQTCNYTRTNDGLHYHRLTMPRLRILAHQINCQYPSPEQ